MVWRPLRASSASAACTASRISFTPENTAEIAMNSASKAVAMRRAIVVLPDPGGPQRIMECGLPDSKARRSGLPGPRRCCWPTTSSIERGRRPRQAVPAAASCRKDRSLLSQYVDALRRHEAERRRVDLRVAHQVEKTQQGRLTEVVGQLHRLDPAAAQPHADALEPRFAVAGLRFEPFEAVALAGVAELERRLDVARAREQGCRGR